MGRQRISNPLLDAYGRFPDVNLINPYSFATSGAFDPLSITGCVLWLKADGSCYNTGTTQATNGQTVETWVDASAGGNNATQATSGSRPEFVTGVLNGLPAVRFTGSKFMDFSGFSLTALTAFTVFTNSTTNGMLLSGTTSPNGNYFRTKWDGDYVGFSHSGDIKSSGPLAVSLSTPSVISWRRPTPTASYWQNGTEYAPASGTSSSTLAFTRLCRRAAPSSDLNINGDVFEILLYNTALGTTDREYVQDGLGAKWGITITH